MFFLSIFLTPGKKGHGQLGGCNVEKSRGALVVRADNGPGSSISLTIPGQPECPENGFLRAAPLITYLLTTDCPRLSPGLKYSLQSAIGKELPSS